MPRQVFRRSLLLVLAGCSLGWSAESRFAVTNSRSEYVHWIDLYDAANRRIDVQAGEAAPYSPRTTCGRCHDYEAILRGHHFNAMNSPSETDPPGEPWIWTDERTGTQLPLSYRDWAGTYNPNALKMDPREFLLKFGHHQPGGGAGEPPAEPEPEENAATEEASDEEPADAVKPDADSSDDSSARWKLSGSLDVDCMLCHGDETMYSPEVWWKQIESENFAWAPTAALGLAQVDGEVSRLPDDFDPAAAEPDSRRSLPKTTYGAVPVNAEGKVYLDVIRTPHNSACYYCHSTDFVGQQAAPEWTYDEDVHVLAGMACADCHRNGIEHHTVRGFEGEQHPTGQDVSSLSCRGCHLGDTAGHGRLGAPRPLHEGLPPLHLEKLSCTACHSGPRPAAQALQVQTAMAHGLGLPSHDYAPEMAPGIVEPAMIRQGQVLYPHRMTWPAFWGSMQDGAIDPLHPETVYDALRRTLRVRRGSSLRETFAEEKLSKEEKVELLGDERAAVAASELTEEEQAKLNERAAAKGMEVWKEKLAEALQELQAILPVETAEAVFVSGGKVYRLVKDDTGSAENATVEVFDHAAAQPYAWKLAHDVRPAQQSLGAKGCYECHADGTPIFEGQVTALAAAPSDEPVTYAMHELAGYDKLKMDAWNASFRGRKAFKYFGFGAMGIASLVLLSYVFAGIHALPGWISRRFRPHDSDS